ncbi:MAG: UDP-N-acetylglucosamine--N-acetylmuramyl-(pentapeptide) pyrophosphoryl-undecaprenol N-acetylglucosamine transferase [Elusimicrobia bacterium]|nr:UDP-N-acetylglucosamine--N-acetylmuramyl-(pentapeptide) pyrophosphoryl-undecaprenol N-acetylglucosamine transferase [Elusimicrobiota bacterium]
MQGKPSHIVFFTGASGGHIYPACVLRKFLDASIVAIKTKTSQKILENQKKVFFIHPLAIKKIRPKAFIDIILLCFFLIRTKPEVFLCFGSYLNLLGVIFGKILGAKVLFFEPNLIPGRGTKLLKNFADKIFYAFPETLKYLPKNKSVQTKIPVRQSHKTPEKIIEEMHFNFSTPVILVLGGSQGSAFINSLIIKNLPHFSFYQIIHITGKRDFEKVKSQYNFHRNKHFVVAFTEKVPDFMKISKVVISRAGAGTLAEISKNKVPSILIPFEAAEGHQKLNAKFLEEKGAAVVFEESQIKRLNLKEIIDKILLEDFWKIKENLVKIELADNGRDLMERLKKWL